MKKTKLVCILGASLALSGCGNAYANISHGGDVVATVGDVTITDGDLYPQMKAGSGAEYTLTMIRQKIYEVEIEVTDEMREQAEEEYDSVATQAESYYDMTMEDYIQRLGYADKDEYIEKVILPNIEQTELNKKYFDENNEEKIQTADVVVVAASACESARLLLNSRTSLFPNGIGNNFDNVGRNLQSHAYTGAWGLFDYDILELNGPGATLGISDFNHNEKEGIIGGVLCTEFYVFGYYRKQNKRFLGFADAVKTVGLKAKYVEITSISGITETAEILRNCSEDTGLFIGDYSSAYVIDSLCMRQNFKPKNILIYDTDTEYFKASYLPPIKAVGPSFKVLGERLCKVLVYKWQNGTYPEPLQVKI